MGYCLRKPGALHRPSAPEPRVTSDYTIRLSPFKLVSRSREPQQWSHFKLWSILHVHTVLYERRIWASFNEKGRWVWGLTRLTRDTGLEAGYSQVLFYKSVQNLKNRTTSKPLPHIMLLDTLLELGTERIRMGVWGLTTVGVRLLTQRVEMTVCCEC